MGLQGYRSLLDRRNQILTTFAEKLNAVATQHGERLLVCQGNDISFGISLDSFESKDEATSKSSNDVSALGAMLFSRCVSGTRVVPRGVQKTVCGIPFDGFGSSADGYPHSYLTAACAIGLSQDEVDLFLRRLDKTLSEFRKKQKK